MGRCYPGEGVELSCEGLPNLSRLPDTIYCACYYECRGSEKVYYECPDATPYFDFKTSVCSAPDEVFCYPSSRKSAPPVTSTSETHTTVTATTSTTPKPSINTCQPNYGFTDPLPHPTDCTKRVNCENGEIVRESSCPNGWIFDYLFLSCIVRGNCFPGEIISCATHGSPETPFIPHPKYCRQYYDCNVENTKEGPIGKACQDPTPFFDYRLGECGSYEDVLCYPGSSRDVPPPCP